MQALTWRGERELPRDVEDEDGPGGEMVVGILAQGAQRREAAEEHEREESKLATGWVAWCSHIGLQLQGGTGPRILDRGW